MTAPVSPAEGALASADGFPRALPALTSVRFLLALGVVLFHLRLNTDLPADLGTGLIERARLGVDVFFILSGFVLAHVYGPQVEAGRYSHRRFLIARIARIYPAHVAVLMLVVSMAAAAWLLGERPDPESYSLGGLVATVLLIHAWFPTAGVNEWNGPSWSLSAEWAAYLIFPVFAWAGWKLTKHPLLLIGIAVLSFAGLDGLYRALSGDILTHAEFNLGVLRIAPEFLYGIGLYQLGRRLKPRRAVALTAAIASSVLLLTLMHVSADERLIVASAGLMVLALALLSGAGADSWTRSPALLEAGEASYALYLLHLPLISVWKNARGLLTGVDSAYMMPLWEAALLLLVTTGAAFVLHSIWERPVRLWARRRFLDAETPTLPPPLPSSAKRSS